MIPWPPERCELRLRAALSLAACLGLACSMGMAPAPVIAQASAGPDVTSSPAPTASQAAATSPSALDLEALMPAEIDGLASEIAVEHGREHLDGLDPEDPSDARHLADIERFVAAAGGTIDGLTSASAVASDGQRALVVVAARIMGVDIDRLTEAFVELLSGAMDAAVAEPGQLGGKSVIILTDEGVEGGDPVYVYAVVDTIWLLAVPREAAVELLSRLP